MLQRTILLAAAALALTNACGKDTDPHQAAAHKTSSDGTYDNCSASNAPVSATVTIKDGAFTVRFVNEDAFPHQVESVASGPQTFNLGEQAAGATTNHVFAATGTVAVTCGFHNMIRLKVVVY
jgi:plastocyanin